jgi:hypothetical protein
MTHSDGRSSFETRHGGPKVGAPGAAEIGADGKVRQPGKRQYWQVLSVAAPDVHERWRPSVLAALIAAGFSGGAP